MFNINTIFPKAFISSNIQRELTDKELQVIGRHSGADKRSPNQGNDTSIERYILNNEPELSDINKFINVGIDFYVNEIIKPRTELQFYVTQSWLNWTKPGQYHHKHTHQNSIISGVFYFNAVKGADKIIFFNESHRYIDILPKEYNMFNSTSWWYPIETGTLLLFPSDLAHMVEETITDQDRISLAFNVFAKGYFGSEQHLTALHL